MRPAINFVVPRGGVRGESCWSLAFPGSCSVYGTVRVDGPRVWGPTFRRSHRQAQGKPRPPLTRQVSLPAGRTRLFTCRYASSRLSKSAPRKRPIGCHARRSMHVAAASYFPRESPVDACWQQEVWHCHEYKSRERCSSRASSPHLLFFTSWCSFFSVVGQWLQR